MKRALVVFLFLAGCTPTFLQSGRYACEPGEPDQCPGAWRCGLEGFCHQLGNTTVAWRCETNADCEGNFVCGFSKSAEFRECHDPGVPKDFPCELASDCVGGWSCGLTSSREKRECHDPARPRGWACADDSDCVGGWRCGTELICVDPSADALGLTTVPAIDGGAHLNALTSKSPVTMLSVSPFYLQAPGIGRGNLAYVQDGHLRARSLDTTTGQFVEYDLGTELPTSVIAQGARGFEIQGGDDQVERVVATLADGGLETWVFSNGTFTSNGWLVSDGDTMNQLAHGSSAGALSPSILGFNSTPGSYYGLIHGDAPFERDLIAYAAADFQEVPGNRIHSMTSLRHAEDVECVYLVDDRGLWVSQVGGFNISSFLFESVNIDGFSHEVCGGGPQPRIDSVLSMDERWLAVTAVTDGGPVQLAVLDALRTWTNRAPQQTDQEWYCTSDVDGACDPFSRIQVDLGYGPCVACPPGTTFENLSTVRNAPGIAPDLEVLCGQPNGAGSTFRLARNGSSSDCTRTLVTGESSFFIERSPVPSVPAPGGIAWGGSSGQIWFGSSTGQIASFTFDRPASGVVRRGTGPDEIIAFTRGLLGTPAPNLGLFSNRSSVLSASVQGAPSLAISGAQLIDLAGTSAISEARPLGFLPPGTPAAPLTAVLTRSAAAADQRLVVVSAGASIYVGDLEAVLSSAGPPVALSSRVSTGEPVSSLAFPRAHLRGAGPIASGYAVAGSNVVRIVADTLARWRTEPVPMPSSLSPRATWFDGTRGRVGFHDGSVFSLPSRVRISRPLLGGDAVDYAQACGQQLVLAPDGLYRLVSDASGGPIGHWENVLLPLELMMTDFTEGRVHGVGNEVFVFTRSGEAARVTFESCPL